MTRVSGAELDRALVERRADRLHALALQIDADDLHAVHRVDLQVLFNVFDAAAADGRSQNQRFDIVVLE